jgi:type I restriction enzyme S subunit
MTGSAGQRRVPRQFLEELQIPLPSIEEQKRIAAILDQADALRGKRSKSLTKLEDLQRSVFSKLTLMSQGQSAATTLGAIVEEFRYGTSQKSEGEGHPTLRIPNVIGGAINLDDLKFVPVASKELDRLRLRQGDILFVRTNGNRDYVGRSAVVASALGKLDEYRAGDFIYASYLGSSGNRVGDFEGS